MTTVATPMAARGLRADIAGSTYRTMTREFDAVSLSKLVTSVGSATVETRVFQVDGQRVTIRIEVEPSAEAAPGTAAGALLAAVVVDQLRRSAAGS